MYVDTNGKLRLDPWSTIVAQNINLSSDAGKDLGQQGSSRWGKTWLKGVLHTAQITTGSELQIADQVDGVLPAGRWGRYSDTAGSVFDANDYKERIDSNGDMYLKNTGAGGTDWVAYFTLA